MFYDTGWDQIKKKMSLKLRININRHVKVTRIY